MASILGDLLLLQRRRAQGCSEREVSYYLFICAHNNMLMFLFEALSSFWVLFIVSIKVRIFLILRRKKKKISTALNSFCFRGARIVLGLLLLFPFWVYCLFGLGFRVFFIFDFCACLCNVVSGDCLSSPIIWESSREKDFFYYVSWSSYWLTRRLMFRQSNSLLIIWLQATVCTLARIWILIFISAVSWSTSTSNFTLNVYCGTVFLTDCHSWFMPVCGLPGCQESFVMFAWILFSTSSCYKLVRANKP